MTERIERQIEQFAPGFRSHILARHSFTATQMHTYNANYVGGDINGGVQDLFQLFTRPALTLNISNPYATPVDGLYLCSSSTPPGGGVHGMCGYFAASAAARFLAGQRGVPAARRLGAGESAGDAANDDEDAALTPAPFASAVEEPAP
jgi:phytoene dehydrogenase-like protein